MDAGEGALTGRVQPRNCRATVEICSDPADCVVGSRGDGNWLPLWVVASLLKSCRKSWVALELNRTQVKPDPPTGRDRAGHDVARGKLISEALAQFVDQDGAVSAQRLREEEAVAHERSRMELHQLEVSELGTRRVGEEQTTTGGRHRVCRSRPQRGISARRQHNRTCLR
jgi:hypothetical protein